MTTTNHRAKLGLAAIKAGTTSDRSQNDLRTNAVDAITNILHAIGDSQTADGALNAAWIHFHRERNES